MGIVKNAQTVTHLTKNNNPSIGSPLPNQNQLINSEKYKWYILSLAAATATLVVAMPTMALPVLFSEISADIGLSLVQIGIVWGSLSLAGLLMGLAGGSLGDRFGTRRFLTISCLALGVTGALRGLSTNFMILTSTVFLSGIMGTAIPMNLHKTCGTWFSRKQLGFANGAVSAGMALGFMTGSMLSATTLSPWLGGWRLVFFFYGGLAILMSIPWALTKDRPESNTAPIHVGEMVSIRQALHQVVHMRTIWLLGIGMLGVGGCIQGYLGYLPIYLREIGWTAGTADLALSSFHAISLLTVFPLATLSDRLGSRKRFLLIATLMIVIGVSSMAAVSGWIIWPAVLLAGCVRDGFMAIFVTTVSEVDGVGAAYTGTALGLTMTLSRVGGLFAPPAGNLLATVDLRLPFLFWAAMALVGLAAFLMVKDKPSRSTRGVNNENQGKVDLGL